MGRRAYNITVDLGNRLVRDHQNGASAPLLEIRYGIAVNVIRKYLKEKGVFDSKCKRWSAEDDNQIVMLRNKGMTYNQMSEVTGRTEPAVNMRVSWLIKHGRIARKKARV